MSSWILSTLGLHTISCYYESIFFITLPKHLYIFRFCWNIKAFHFPISLDCVSTQWSCICCSMTQPYIVQIALIASILLKRILAPYKSQNKIGARAADKLSIAQLLPRTWLEPVFSIEWKCCRVTDALLQRLNPNPNKSFRQNFLSRKLE